MKELTREEALSLAADAVKVIEDFLPNIGRCALQNYGRLNDVMVRAAQAGMTNVRGGKITRG